MVKNDFMSAVVAPGHRDYIYITLVATSESKTENSTFRKSVTGEQLTL